MENREYSRKCRFCLHEIDIKRKFIEIDATIKQQFYDLTQINLNTNDYSASICVKCKKELEKGTRIRLKFIKNQVKVDEICSERQYFSEILNIKVEPIENFEDDFHNDSFDSFEDVAQNLLEINDEKLEEAPKTKKNKRRMNENNSCSKPAKSLAVCPTCGVLTTHLSRHIIQKHKKDEKRYFCDLCDHGTYLKSLLASHMKRHKPRLKIFTCDLCNRKFSRKESISIHFKYFHAAAGEYPCDCGRIYKRKMALYQHIRIRHSANTVAKAKCHICGKNVRQDYLKSHIQKIHRDVHVSIACDICGKVLKNKKLLNQHQIRIHDVKNFVCNFPCCNKAYWDNTSLQVHLKTHTNEKDFACSYEGCNKKYFRNQTLKKHIIISHDKYAKNCPVPGCSYASGRNTIMKTHLKGKHSDLSKEMVKKYHDEIKKMKLVY